MQGTITVTEAAADAGITRYAVWVAIRRGRLQAEKRGRDWHIERTEWDRYKREVLRGKVADRGTDGDTAGDGGATQA